MRRFIILSIACLLSFISIPSSAQTKCEGPAEMCAEIKSLQDALKAKSDKDKTEIDALHVDEDVKIQAKEKLHAERMQKVVGIAAILAVVLKMLLSGLKSWSDFFTTDKGKAWLKIITLLVGMAAFLATNIGFGLPWWQAIILAGGGPAAIALHELTGLIPVILGKGKLPVSQFPPPPNAS